MAAHLTVNGTGLLADPAGAILLQGALFVVTDLLVAIPAVRRALTPPGLKRHRVH